MGKITHFCRLLLVLCSFLCYSVCMAFNTQKLKRIMFDAGLRMADIDRALGVVGVTSKYVNKTYEPKPDRLFEILIACGMNENDLKSQLMSDWYEIPTPPQAPG